MRMNVFFLVILVILVQTLRGPFFSFRDTP
jgi:hypothetical protein